MTRIIGAFVLILGFLAGTSGPAQRRGTAESPEAPEGITVHRNITYVSKDDPSMLIIHGDQDKLVPYHQSVLLKDALEAIGAPVEFYRVEGGGHGWFKDPKVPELTKAFLEKHLKP